MGGLLTAAVAAVYGVPYIETARVVGTRDPAETARYSAEIGSYLAAPDQNWLWGWTAFSSKATNDVCFLASSRFFSRPWLF